MKQPGSSAILIIAFLFLFSCNNSDNKTVPDAGHKTDTALAAAGIYKMEMSFKPDSIEISMPVDILISLNNTVDTSLPVMLDVVHEQKIHLIVVTEDLSWFNHIHPQQQRDGNYLVSTSFPFAGNYLLFADYKPSGGSQAVYRSGVSVHGKLTAPPVSNDNKLVSDVNGHTVTLVNGNDLKTNTGQAINFSIEKDGKKLTAAHMEPYLGAAAHIVIISRSEKEFMHVHAESSGPFPIAGSAHFTKPGVYRIWMQFKTYGLVHTADFTVNVSGGEMKKENKHDNGHQH